MKLLDLFTISIGVFNTDDTPDIKILIDDEVMDIDEFNLAMRETIPCDCRQLYTLLTTIDLKDVDTTIAFNNGVTTPIGLVDENPLPKATDLYYSILRRVGTLEKYINSYMELYAEEDTKILIRELPNSRLASTIDLVILSKIFHRVEIYEYYIEIFTNKDIEINDYLGDSIGSVAVKDIDYGYSIHLAI